MYSRKAPFTTLMILKMHVQMLSREMKLFLLPVDMKLNQLQ
jgi:hypothetical protein